MWFMLHAQGHHSQGPLWMCNPFCHPLWHICNSQSLNQIHNYQGTCHQHRNCRTERALGTAAGQIHKCLLGVRSRGHQLWSGAHQELWSGLLQPGLGLRPLWSCPPGCLRSRGQHQSCRRALHFLPPAFQAMPSSRNPFWMCLQKCDNQPEFAICQCLLSCHNKAVPALLVVLLGYHPEHCL